MFVVFVVAVVTFGPNFEDGEREYQEREYRRQMEQPEQERLSDAQGSAD